MAASRYANSAKRNSLMAIARKIAHHLSNALRHSAVVLLVSVLASHSQAAAKQESQTTSSSELPQGVSDSPLLNSRFLLFGSRSLRRQTLRWATERQDTDMVAALIYTLRYLEAQKRPAVVKTLRKLTGQRLGDHWFKWVVWQQQQQELVPFDGFDVFLSALFANIDKKFSDYIYPGVEHRIRLEEIVWGGAAAGTGIPTLTNPQLISAVKATYLAGNEKVFGVAINGDARAYPYRIMDWHEMLNDVVGGVPVTLAYCTLCGSGILFDSKPEGTHALAGTPLIFGSSGLLYRSNKLMYDHVSNSLWNQFTGKPAVGTLAHTDLQLTARPMVTTTWKEWLARHPDTSVLDINTGYERDYRPGVPYGDYFASPDLLFPAASDKQHGKPKSELFVLRITGSEKAWPLERFKGGAVINDQVGALKLVLVGNARTKTVRAYRREEYSFSVAQQQLQAQNPEFLKGDSGVGTETWQITEAALVGPNQQRLTRLPGHLAYNFAWQTYVNEKDPATGR